MIEGATVKVEVQILRASYRLDFKTNNLTHWRTFGWVETHGVDAARAHAMRRLTDHLSSYGQTLEGLEVRVEESGS